MGVYLAPTKSYNEVIGSQQEGIATESLKKKLYETHKMASSNKILTLGHKLPVTICLLLAVAVSSSIAVQVTRAKADFEDVKLDKENEKEEARRISLARPERVTVVAPKHLRPRSDYHVLVTLANSESPATVDLQLTGARDSDHEQNDAKSVLINSGETQTIKFSVGDWPPAEYLLSVNAQAVDRSWNFTDESVLSYHTKSYSTLIQTDKAIYKPGQLVQFRAIFLNENFAPFSMKDEINVTVVDAKRNIVKQWTSSSNWRGLLSLDLQLSEDPVLGDWTIKVEARNQEASKGFQVAEYILPTFDVNIQLPSFATYNDSDIVATVKASYTYGKPVNGHVTLTVQPLVRFAKLSTRPLDQKQFRSRLVNGSADIEVDLVKDLKQERDLFEREIEFFALVEEDLTGRKYNKTEIFKLHDRNIKVEQINKGESFKPGLTYLTQLKVAYQDDTPVEDNGPELELRYETSSGKTLEVAKLRPTSGIVEHLIQIPKRINDSSSDKYFAPNYIEMVVTYRGQKYYLSSIASYNSQSEEYLQVSLPQLRPTNGRRRRASPSISVNDELKVMVQSTEPIQQVTCHGLARGDIIWAVSPDAKNRTELEFEVKVDQRMAPEATILCFYIRPENKEMIADSIRVQVNGLSRNLVKLTTSREEAKPGQEVDIGVITKPNSLIGVLGIDQSVLLLRSGNDISQADLKNEMKSYGNPSMLGLDGFQVTARNAHDLFSEVDVVVLTNNLVHDGFGYRFGKAALYSGAYLKMAAQAQPVAMSSSNIALDALVLNHEIHPPEFHVAGKQKGEQLVIRSQFPETWLWANATAGPDGSANFKAKMPDTITSWVLSAFSLSEAAGFGLSTGRTSIRVFRPFFIKLNLPYSIIRGETVSIQAIVFNYSKRPTAAKVTLENNNGDFEFVEAANNIEDEKTMNKSSESRLIRVPPEDGVAVSFLITPQKLGHIDIKMTAQGEFAADGLVKKLLVKPEGQTQFLNKALLVNLAEAPESSVSRNFSIDVPANAVPGSQKVFVSVVGDIMGPGLSNVDDLLRLPYGCGEQNMINLVPNIVILNYLKNTKRLRDAQRVRAVRNIETGYQRQLNYKRSDGSFSAFGQSDKEGSVWLTAYVLKTLQQAKGIITVDEKVIRRAANFISFFSRKDGSVEEVGMLHNKNLQSSSAKNSDKAPTYLTAYAMIALLQGPIKQDGDNTANVALDEVLDRGLGFLERQLDEAAASENPYNLAIIAYALQLTNRQASKDRAYEQLWSKARENEDKIWWQDGDKQNGSGSGDASSGRPSNNDTDGSEREFETNIGASKPPTSTPQRPLKPLAVTSKHSAHLFVPDSLSIEMTALALLSTVKRGELDRALPIVRWLIGQQNSNGGFASTQDTVLAIEALASFAEATTASKIPPSMNIELSYARNQKKSDIRSPSTIEELTVSRSNALLTQQLRLPDNITWVQVHARGSGAAVLQVAWQYNLVVSAEQPAFYLNPIIDKSSNINYLQLSICTYYKAGEASNMALMEVELPSGYTADVEALPGLTRTKDIKRVDTVQGDTKVVIYLDKVGSDEICLTVPAHRTHKVGNNKPVPVIIYDYYNRQQAARIFYEPHLASSCEICDWEACLEVCSRKPKQTSGRLVSLHEQRKLSSPQVNSHANLTAPPTNGSHPLPGLQGNHSILPLAPVLVTLVAAARNLYTH